jgi:hypothetical protein
MQYSETRGTNYIILDGSCLQKDVFQFGKCEVEQYQTRSNCGSTKQVASKGNSDKLKLLAIIACKFRSLGYRPYGLCPLKKYQK